MNQFFNALTKMLQGVLAGNGKYEEVSYIGLVMDFVRTVIGVFFDFS